MGATTIIGRKVVVKALLVLSAVLGVQGLPSLSREVALEAARRIDEVDSEEVCVRISDGEVEVNSI
ncbi:hypothetical protein [Vulcanisaeta sp. JCM 16159]|uniref:hypothetical protein n=1 Tax=Vulcanisaeta sp. JCM 16159 TaxID=1295371 RepID=UPI0006D1450B|nr:hypothetical protein [Vulcanisaeta sp. JCM 16159]